MQKTKPKLHIIVNCANRKSTKNVIALGDISENNPEKLTKIWWQKLNNNPQPSDNQNKLFDNDKNKIVAQDLYVGNYWSIIKKLPNEAILAGFEPTLWIVSAGYGLINASDEIYSYSATFNQGNSDSVFKNSYNTNKIEFLQLWWELISDYSLPDSSKPRRISQLIENNQNDSFLFVLSLDYLTAVEQDLFNGVKLLKDIEKLMIITPNSKFSKGKYKNNIIPSSARLQCNRECKEICKKHLLPKGVRGVIGAYLALKIIQKSEIWGSNATDVKQNIESFIKQSPKLLDYNRKTLSDREVQEFILNELNVVNSFSCTALLRKLRESGRACEQKRFKKIYWNVREENNEIKKNISIDKASNKN